MTEQKRDVRCEQCGFVNEVYLDVDTTYEQAEMDYVIRELLKQRRGDESPVTTWERATLSETPVGALRALDAVYGALKRHRGSIGAWPADVGTALDLLRVHLSAAKADIEATIFERGGYVSSETMRALLPVVQDAVHAATEMGDKVRAEDILPTPEALAIWRATPHIPGLTKAIRDEAARRADAPRLEGFRQGARKCMAIVAEYGDDMVKASDIYERLRQWTEYVPEES